MMIVFPDDDGPNSLVRSTVIVRMFPATAICTFFMSLSPWAKLGRSLLDLDAGSLNAVEDAVELVPAVGVGGPDGIEAVELGEVAQAAVGRLRHRPLPAPVATEALGRIDPEALRCLLVEETRALAHGNGGEKESRCEPDGARGRRDEVREVAEGPEIEVPALRREQRTERRALCHVGRAERFDPRYGGRLAPGDRAPIAVAAGPHAGLLEQPTPRRPPEGQRGQALLRRHDPLGLVRREASAACQYLG